jgi:pyrrolidone-carboxylate peptidase
MIVLTGFEKFSSYKSNLSDILVNQFEDRIGENQVQKQILPVSWRRSVISYKNKLSNLGKFPDLVILLGIHSGSDIRIERYAWNISIGMDEDNKFRFSPIKLNLKSRIKTILNIENYTRIKTQGLSIRFSNYMGFFLCNYIFFNALLFSANLYPVMFIHIPDRGPINELKFILKKIITITIRTMKGSRS